MKMEIAKMQEMLRRPTRSHVQCVYCGENHLLAECQDPRSRPCANCGRFGHDVAHCRLPRRLPYSQPYGQPYLASRPQQFFERGAPLALPVPNDIKPAVPRMDINPTGIPRPLGPYVTHPPSDAPVHYVEEPNEEETYVYPYVSHDEEGNAVLMDYRPVPVMGLGRGRGRGLGG